MPGLGSPVPRRKAFLPLFPCGWVAVCVFLFFWGAQEIKRNEAPDVKADKGLLCCYPAHWKFNEMIIDKPLDTNTLRHSQSVLWFGLKGARKEHLTRSRSPGKHWPIRPETCGRISSELVIVIVLSRGITRHLLMGQQVVVIPGGWSELFKRSWVPRGESVKLLNDQGFKWLCKDYENGSWDYTISQLFSISPAFPFLIFRFSS